MSRGRGVPARGLSSVELAVIIPLVLVIVFGAIQTAIHYHARNTAESAAAACAERARGYDATGADGERTGRSVITQVSGLTAAQVRATVSATEVRCTVTGAAPALFRMGSQTVTAEAVMPRERV